VVEMQKDYEGQIASLRSGLSRVTTERDVTRQQLSDQINLYRATKRAAPVDEEDVGYAPFPVKCAICGTTVEKNGPCPGGCGYSY
jgi:hypothetical protein